MSLTIFLWFYIVLIGFDAVCRLIFLSHHTYPRQQCWDRSDDALRVIVCVVLGAWAFILLP